MSNYTGDPSELRDKFLLMDAGEILYSKYKNRSIWIPAIDSHISRTRSDTIEYWQVLSYPFNVFKVLKIKRRL